jgi:hypothetical protein
MNKATITKKCEYCGTSFEAALSEHKRGYARYCSRSCGTKGSAQKRYPNKKPNLVCAECNKKFYRQNSKQVNSKSGLFFCSRKCKDAAQRIGGMSQIQPPHYGTGTGAHSYRAKAFRKMLHRCAFCHSEIYVEVYPVHHIDFNRKNNHISNLLIVCPCCHTVIHFHKKGWIVVDDPVEIHLLTNLPKLNIINRSPR